MWCNSASAFVSFVGSSANSCAHHHYSGCGCPQSFRTATQKKNRSARGIEDDTVCVFEQNKLTCQPTGIKQRLETFPAVQPSPYSLYGQCTRRTQLTHGSLIPGVSVAEPDSKTSWFTRLTFETVLEGSCNLQESWLALLLCAV